jgi:hypothetical protein
MIVGSSNGGGGGYGGYGGSASAPVSTYNSAAAGGFSLFGGSSSTSPDQRYISAPQPSTRTCLLVSCCVCGGAVVRVRWACCRCVCVCVCGGACCTCVATVRVVYLWVCVTTRSLMWFTG